MDKSDGPIGGRSNYSKGELNEGDLLPDPTAQLQQWIEDAAAANAPEPLAAALATADSGGAPSVRMVLIRGVGSDGIRFYTNRESRKGRDLAVNPRAAVSIWWPTLERQVRFSGSVRRLGDADSAAYFASRPRDSQLGARLSRQGEPIAARADLEAALAAESAAFPGDTPIPLPAYWGGYLLTPERWEFWQGRPNRLHDRFEYLPRMGGWEIRRLQP